MGFDADGVKCLLAAKASGVSFQRVATLGRQELHLSFIALQRSLKMFNLDKSYAEIEQLFLEENGYAEPLLRMLGAEEISSIDASPYEGATVLHDMNLIVPSHMKNAFTLVIDGGSLEHIFNIPTAAKNCLEMVQVGGHFLSLTPANNYTGHGFYQFSPDFFFRILSSENGFAVECLILFESGSNQWYQVSDPAQLRERVIFRNLRSTRFFVLGQKIAQVPIFSTLPQQSDYQHVRWRKEQDRFSYLDMLRQEHPLKKALRRITPEPCMNLYHGLKPLLGYLGRFRPPYFKKINISRLAKP